MKLTTTVAGSGGVPIHVVESGNPEGPPILFIHGWAQCHLSWTHQLEGALAAEHRLLAMDLRGHGGSGRPDEQSAYSERTAWADDVHAVLTTLQARGAVLVGWSYGGLVICDYLDRHGSSDVAAVNFVGAAVGTGHDRFTAMIGSGFIRYAMDCASPDPAVSVPATRGFLSECTHEAMEPSDWDAALVYNGMVPASVKGWLLRRQVQNDELLAGLTLPVLVSHGLADTIISPASAEYIEETCPPARISWYEHVGHCPFLEFSERFDTELAELVQSGRRTFSD